MSPKFTLATSGSALLNSTATSAPRQGKVGVLPITEVAIDAEQNVELTIAVVCPECSNYARVWGYGEEYRNITKLVDPLFACSVCTWKPTTDTSPEVWDVYYQGRLGGTLVFAMNEEHLDVLVQVLETPPKRRGMVEFPWEYKALMGRLPNKISSGRFRNSMVSLIKRLQRTRPAGL